MNLKAISATGAPKASGGYAQAVEVTGATKLLFVSGQIPLTAFGALPESFEEQCRLVWANVEAQLRAAELTLDHLVKVTTFLSHRKYADQNRAVRESVLGSRAPALTVIIVGIFDESWLVEIEAIAAA